jgi:hypothetical protein
MAAMERGVGARVGFYGLRSGTTAISTVASVSSIGSLNSATNWLLGHGAYGPNAAMSMSAFYIGAGTGAAGGMCNGLSTVLSNFASYMKSQTGTEAAEGVFIPDCSLYLDADPAQAPRVSDLRTTRGPTGIVLGLSGNSFRRHRGLVWSHVPIDRVWESHATYANGSWESFFNTTQMGFGHAWFTPSSPIQIYCHDGTVVGGAYNNGAGVSGWYITGLDSIEPRNSEREYTQLFRIELPEIVSPG